MSLVKWLSPADIIQENAKRTWGEKHVFGHGGALYRLSTGKRAVKERGESESLSVMSDSLQPHGLHSPWNSQGQYTRILPQIFPTQGFILGLPHCRRILYQLSYQGSLRIRESVAYPFSRWIFLTREWNWYLLLYRQIFYQMSYQGSPP